MSMIPRDKGLDSTLALARRGYRYIGETCDRLQSQVFRTRLLLRETVCMRGEEAARVMYDNPKLTRHGATPKPILQTLLGETGVQTLDGERHRARKQVFLDLLTGENATELARQVDAEWRARLPQWEKKSRVVLHDAATEILCFVVCKWAGVPIAESEIRMRTGDFEAMIDGPARPSIRHLQARRSRKRAERWVSALVESVRNGSLAPPAGSALRVIANYREEGRLLPSQVAAVEVLNVLRPTVAIAWYITFAALALHEHPTLRERVRTGGPEYREMFVQEVRRLYPFFPFVGAEVQEPFEGCGHAFSRGNRVLLDLYGTNHAPESWPSPESFDPERFRNWDGNPYSFIPQGGGDPATDHRCPGEEITVEVLKVAAGILADVIDYDVAEQDLSFSLSRIPTQPRSGLVLTNVRRGIVGSRT